MEIGDKRVLDPCCGSKMFWFNPHNPDVIYTDIREVNNQLIWQSKDGKQKRYITIQPDATSDFTDLPFESNSFWHVVFDPPHLVRLGKTSWLAAKYGVLHGAWENAIHDGFWECMRVLKPNGTLIFKWSEIDISVSQILKIIEATPLYGHKSGKHMSTHWMAFIKDDGERQSKTVRRDNNG